MERAEVRAGAAQQRVARQRVITDPQRGAGENIG
jgi:hypothetical protein